MEQKLLYKSGNNKLYGLLNINNDSDEMVVICHARTSSKDSRPTTKLANLMNDLKMNNFRFDFIACGESDGKMVDYTVSEMVNNLNDTLDFLSESYQYKNFILIGCSMGARIISLVNKEKYNIKKLILWYGALDYGRSLLNLPSKMERIAKKQGYYVGEHDWKFSYKYFKDERNYKAYKNLYNWNVPKLFVHGTKDPFVNYRSSISIFKKCNNSKLCLIKDGDHGFHDEISMQEALNVTKDFLVNKV